MKIRTFFLALMFIFSAPVQADTIQIEHGGQQIVLELPESVCDISERGAGKRIMAFLEQQLAKMPVAPTPKGIINQCQNPDYDPYPWGYVASMESSQFITNQAQLNQKAEKDMETSAFSQRMKEVMDEAKKVSDPEAAIKEGFGIDIAEMEFGIPQLLSVDEHALHMLMKNQYQVNGALLKETVYISLMHVKGKVVYWYMYDNGETDFNPIEWINRVNKAGSLTER